MTTFYLLILFMLPAVMAVGIAIPRRRELSAQWVGELVIATALLVLGAMLALCRLPVGTVIVSPVVGLSFTFGGFQRLYGLVVCFMWLICAMLSPQYFRGHHHLRRYYFFFLICLSFTLGVFLSADLKTTFLFFELMSLGSYVWVVQEETPEALDAGKTYLTIAVLGGLVTLMGLFLLQHLTGTLVLSALKAACAAVTDRTALWWAALCVFFGFAAKAGIFGILVVTVYLLPGSRSWGVLVLILGCITMVLGAVMAVFSTNLKYILACSSLSQIGFILVGVAMLTLLGEHNALAAHGTVLYMLNHSLVKLTLFLFAGVVYYNTHQLDLNRIRGFGRGKPLLHGLFLCGACSLAGIPGFLGYISKTLVHEAVVELAVETGSSAITAVEWLFLLSGGLTAAYLTKIYVAVFWQKAPADAHAASRRWGTPLSVAALMLAAIPLPMLGLLPHGLSEKIADATLSFTGGHDFSHAVHYLAWENLKGVVISLSIGMLVYFLLIRPLLTERRDGEIRYRSLWPAWLSLEESVYKPFFRWLIRVLMTLCRVACDLLDLLVLVMRRTLLRDTRDHVRRSPHSSVVRAMSHNSKYSQEETADHVGTVLDTFQRMEGSLSFALLMACLGLCLILLCVILHVFG